MNEKQMIALLESQGYSRDDIKRAIESLWSAFGDEIAAGNASGIIRDFLDSEE